ncbi:DUF1254 domain-containing protein [Rubinisphaera italica]|uniref:DUF1254 domain-containing protein n=1 Tax=Rubinisphaera italica TaxID=2527969 RepID=A0A5C5XES5_9PLAN|nr:DUF1254 domain-containing protein [Rubinisphaera italica]TWT60931.1 hypothetical protein Pan54_16630 [Rubinisphaera italica]
MKGTILAIAVLGLIAGPHLTQIPKLKMASDVPPSITVADKVETSIGTLEFFDGVPKEKTVTKLYDFMDRGRAVEAFLSCIPAMSMEQIRAGLAAAGADECHEIVIFDKLMDSKSLFLTGNTSTMYAMGFLDLKRDGPTVIELPQGMLGMINDRAFLYVTDLGMAGPDKGKGGKYLVLPPGFKGEVPDGYFVVKTNTYGHWLFMRGLLDKGLKAASDNIRNNLKVYPLSRAASPKDMSFTNISGKTVNTILPNDVSFFERIHALIQIEPDSFLGPERKGLLASIGIEKGKKFRPSDRMKQILSDAAAIANGAARAISIYPRNPGQFVYGPDSPWLMAYGDKDTTFTRNGARVLDARIFFHFGYICVSPAMAVTIPGKGSDYAMNMVDSNDQALDGAKTYKLTVPPNVPAKDFWAVTVYDTQTRSQLQTDQQFPTVGSQSDGIQKNDDGSYDIYFSPEAPEGKNANWLQTVPSKSWWIVFRMYGPEQAWIDKSWRPSEIELVN